MWITNPEQQPHHKDGVCRGRRTSCNGAAVEGFIGRLIVGGEGNCPHRLFAPGVITGSPAMQYYVQLIIRLMGPTSPSDPFQGQVRQRRKHSSSRKLSI